MGKFLLSVFLGICGLLSAQFNIGFEASEGYTTRAINRKNG